MTNLTIKDNEKVRNILGDIPFHVLNYLEISDDIIKEWKHNEHRGYLQVYTDKIMQLIESAITEARESERAWAYKNMRDHGCDHEWVEVAKQRLSRIQQKVELKDNTSV